MFDIYRFINEYIPINVNPKSYSIIFEGKKKIPNELELEKYKKYVEELNRDRIFIFLRKVSNIYITVMPNDKTKTFITTFFDIKGSPTFRIEEIGGNIKILENLDLNFLPLHFRAFLAHIIWKITNNKYYALFSIDSYISLFKIISNNEIFNQDYDTFDKRNIMIFALNIAKEINDETKIKICLNSLNEFIQNNPDSCLSNELLHIRSAFVD